MRGLRMRRVTLTTSLFTILMVAVASVGLLLATYTFWEARRAARETALTLLERSAAEVALEADRVIRPAVSIAELASSLPSVSQRPDLLVHPVGWYLMRALRESPSLYAGYMAFANGEFYQMISLSADGGLARVAHQAPPEARFAQRMVRTTPQGVRIEAWTFLDERHRIVGSRVVPLAGYDPRQRPWYRMAETAEGLIATGVYTFASSGKPGFTIARRFDGNIPGVFGVDIMLGDLERFLIARRLTPGSRVAIAEGNGTLLATVGFGEYLAARSAAGQALSPVRVQDWTDPVLARLHRDGLTAEPGGRVTLDGVDYLYSSLPIEAGASRGLHVLVAVPEADFTGVLVTMRDRSIVFTLAVILLGLPLALLVSRQMANALRMLATEADRMRHLDLDDRPPVRSFVREIDQLATAFEAMKGSIRSFGVYVPKALVEQILTGQGDVELGGRRETVSILFSDIEGFTPLAEQMAPEDVMLQTSMLFEEINLAVTRHRGVIDKYIGDAVMALWNAPKAVENHAWLACLAMLEAADRVGRFNADLAANGFPVMPVRFGLHCGEAVVGNVGSSDRMNFTAVGSVVNIASRLEGMNKFLGSRLVVSGDVLRMAGEGFVTRLLAVAAPKGSSEPVEVHELLGLAPGIAIDGVPQASAGDADYCRAWNRAQTMIRNRMDWESGVSELLRLTAQRPNDPVARKSEQWALSLRQTPPQDGWSPVLHLQEK